MELTPDILLVVGESSSAFTFHHQQFIIIIIIITVSPFTIITRSFAYYLLIYFGEGEQDWPRWSRGQFSEVDEKFG